MTQRSWEPAWQAYKAARDEEVTAMEYFLSTPNFHEESRRGLLAAKRKARDAEVTFWEAHLADQSIKR